MPKLTTKTLTVPVIEQAKVKAKPYELRDAARPGMSLIVHPTGVRTWTYGYRVNGKFRKTTLGRYSSDPKAPDCLTLAAARERVADMRAAVQQGQDPAEDKKRVARGHADFVEVVWNDYVARHLEPNAKASSVAKFKGIFEKQVKPKWKGRRIDAIDKRDVLEIVDDSAKRGPHAANSVVTVLSSFFGWCMSRDIVKMTPMLGVKKPTVEVSRERTLSDNELKTIWKGCDNAKVNPAYAALVRLLILTGCRRTEVAEMRWSELDLANRAWIIPGERTKNAQEHRVYLTDSMLAIIEAMPRIEDCKFVLTTRENAAISGFSKMKTFLDKATPKLAHWTLHDTRRTIASGLARMGVALTTIERVLNHQSDSFSPLVRTYQRHDFASEMQKAWELWSDHVAAVIAGKTSNVVALRAPGLVPA